MKTISFYLVVFLGIIGPVMAGAGAVRNKDNHWTAKQTFPHGTVIRKVFTVQDAQKNSLVNLDLTNESLEVNKIGAITDTVGVSIADTSGETLVLFDTSAGNIAIGTAVINSTSMFETYMITNINDNIYFKVSEDAVGPSLRLRKARGGHPTKAVVQDGDNLGSITFDGYYGGGLSGLSGLIRVSATQNFSSGNLGSTMKFYTTSNGSGTSTERMRIQPDGKVGIGTSAPNMELQFGTDGGIDPTAGGEIAFRYNMYNDGANRYLSAGEAAATISMDSVGAINFYTTGAVSGGASSVVTNFGSTTRMKIQADGTVSIGKNADTTPALDVNGHVHATQYVTTSDEDLKKNVLDLACNLSEFKSLKPKSYKWKTKASEFSKAQKAKLKAVYGEAMEAKTRTVEVTKTDEDGKEYTEEVEEEYQEATGNPDYSAVAKQKSGTKVGFLAQDFEGTTYSNCVVDLDGGAKGLDYACITASMWAVNQALLTRIEALEAK